MKGSPSAPRADDEYVHIFPVHRYKYIFKTFLSNTKCWKWPPRAFTQASTRSYRLCEERRHFSRRNILSVGSNYICEPLVWRCYFLRLMHWCYFVRMQAQMLLQHSTCDAIRDARVLCEFMNINDKNEAVLSIVVFWLTLYVTRLLAYNVGIVNALPPPRSCKPHVWRQFCNSPFPRVGDFSWSVALVANL
jgi:hypothetical protein